MTADHSGWEGLLPLPRPPFERDPTSLSATDPALLRELIYDHWHEEDRERLILQEGWTIDDFEHRLREDGCLDDL